MHEFVCHSKVNALLSFPRYSQVLLEFANVHITPVLNALPEGDLAGSATVQINHRHFHESKISTKHKSPLTIWIALFMLCSRRIFI